MNSTKAAVAVAFVVLAAVHAGAATYYVRSDGNDAWDGLSATFVSDTNGPKATLGNAVSTVNAAGVGYHTVDIGAGTFELNYGTGEVTPTRTMRLVGQGSTGVTATVLHRTEVNQNFVHFRIASVSDSSASEPLLFSGMKLSCTNWGNLVVGGGGVPHHVRFEDVSLDNLAVLTTGIRLNHNVNGGVGNTDWVFKNFSARYLPNGEVLFMRSNAQNPAPRSQRWVWDTVNVSDNGNIWVSLAGNRWVTEGFRLTNSVWSRNAINGAYGLNGSTHTDVLGESRIDDSTIEDNNNWGVWAPRLGTNASLIIVNSTIRDTGVGHVQATNVYVTTPPEYSVPLGHIRAVDSSFDGATGGSVGIYVEDNGAIQTSPIELKSVAFNNCEVGLLIGGTTANLWYIDPSQSGATIGSGTLVSGGRMTVYGDADLDGDVDGDDVTAVGGLPFTYSASATWATGDFDFDGDFDADDWAYLPGGDTTTDTSSTTTTVPVTTESTTSSTTTTSSTSTTAPLVVADDVADNYGDAWAGNGGTGFDAWVFVTDVPAGAAGGFLANTTAQTDLNYIWSTPDFKAWGTYANGPGYQAVVAFRAFAGNALSASGDVFRVSMEHGAVQAGTTCGMVLRNGNDNLIVDDFDNGQRLQFFFRGGDANYKLIDDAGERDSGVAWTADGLDLVVTLTGSDTYRLDIYQANGGALANSLTGTLVGTGMIDSLALFNRDAEDANVYFNKLSLATATAVTTTTDTSTTTTTTTFVTTTTTTTTTDSTTTTTTIDTSTTTTSTTSTTTTTAAVLFGEVEIIGSWGSGLTHAAEAGTERVLIFVAHAESDVNPFAMNAVTYGGQPMTKVVDRFFTAGGALSTYTCAFILDEAGIAAASGDTFVPNWSSSPTSGTWFESVFLQSVNQTVLTGATSTTGTTDQTATAADLTNLSGDLAVLAATHGFMDNPYVVGAGWTQAYDESTPPTSSTVAGGYQLCTGTNVTPSVTFGAAGGRQTLIAFVVQAAAAGTTTSSSTTSTTTTDTSSTTDTSTTSTTSTLPITQFSSVQTGAYHENSTWDVDANPGGGSSADTVAINDTHTVTVAVADDAAGDAVTIHNGGALFASRGTVGDRAFAGAALILDGGTLSYDSANVASLPGGDLLVQSNSTLVISSGAPANPGIAARFGSLNFESGPGDGFVLNVQKNDALMPGAAVFTNGTITVSGVISNDIHDVGLHGMTLAGGATLTKLGSGMLEFDKFALVEGPVNFQAGRINFLSENGIRAGSLIVPAGGTLWGQRLDTKYSWNLGGNHPTITLSEGSSLLFDIGNQLNTVGGNIVVNGNVAIDSYSAFSDTFRYVVYRGLSFSGAGHVLEFRQTGGSTQPQFTVFDTDVAINEDATIDTVHATAVADLRAVTFTAGKTLTKRGVGSVVFGSSVSGDGSLTIEAGNVSSASALDLDTLTFIIDGPTLGSDYGQLLMGNQNLTSTRLDVLSADAATNDTFVLVVRAGGTVALNDLNDVAIGEGGVFVSSDNGEWVLSYAGGDGNDVAVVYAGIATSTTTTDTTDTSSTSTIATTTTSSSSTTAGITYFVRTAAEGGNDSWDGLSPTHLGGYNGPKLHVDNAVSTANPVDGYHTIDIGVGVFKTIQVGPTRPMRIVGKGIGQTLLDGPNSASLYHFSIAGLVGASATRPLLLRDFTFVNTNAANGNLILAGGGAPDHVRLEQVSADNFEGLLYGIRMNNNTPGGIGNADWVFKNFSATNIVSGGGEWLFLRSNASTPAPRTQRWVFDQVTITDNGTIYGSLTDGRWVVEGFRLTNSTWSRNGNNGSFGLNGSTTTDFLGRNRIDDSTIEDNNLYGVWAPRMGAGADLIIENSIIRDTPTGHVQCTQVHVTIEAATTIGQIRAVNTVFDSLGGCGGSRGLYVEDNGAVQTSPIELKNVAFNNCDTGLFIGGTSANLWYIDPAQSGATITGGTLVSGGRMTVYGDANLDGEVNGADIASVGGFPFTYRENATWADGDFDFDGDFDAQDWMWLPVPNALWLIIR